jgi:protein Xni
VNQKYDVQHHQLIDYWAMAGDPTNNIKGVPKVGKKTASALLQQYGSLDGVLADVSAQGPATRVQKDRDLVLRCRQLVTLKTDIELGINLKSMRLATSSL